MPGLGIACLGSVVVVVIIALFLLWMDLRPRGRDSPNY